MTRTDLRCRGTGILLIVAGAGSGFATHGMAQGPLRELSDAASFAIALTGFGVACLGTILLFGGSSLRARWHKVCDRASRHPTTIAGQPSTAFPVDSREDPFLYHAAFSGCGRMAIATYLILRAQAEQQACSQQGSRHSRRQASGSAGITALQYQHEKI